MSTQKNETASPRTIGAEAVERYLHEHPDFFVNRDHLLMELSLTHPTGAAVSLIERQVILLREQNRRQRRQLQELLQIARDNDDLMGRLQRLTLSLLDARRPQEMLTLLQIGLRQDFHADAAVMRLFIEARKLAIDAEHLDFLDFAAIDPDALMDGLSRMLDGGKPVCGRLKPEQLEYLFGEDTAIASAALLPLYLSDPRSQNRRTLGLLAIGSRKSERFNAEMGTTFLGYMAELIGRKLAQQLFSDAVT